MKERNSFIKYNVFKKSKKEIIKKLINKINYFAEWKFMRSLFNNSTDYSKY